MILIISNRTINLQAQGPDVFEACLNPVGATDVVLAKAEQEPTGNWQINLVPMPPQGSWMDCGPSCELLMQLVQRMKSREEDHHPGGLRFDHDNKTYNWIFLIPGYSSTAQSGLDQARKLEQEYDANVMLFSWPADPLGLDRPTTAESAYRQAQAAARVSAIQLDRSLERLALLFSQPLRSAANPPGLRFCLLIHSLGNYVFESYIRNPVYGGETGIFDTIVMHQPDVSEQGLEEWVPRIAFRDALYLTINEFDAVLRVSSLVNGVRAGLAGGADPKRLVKFIDFTHGRNVQVSHFMFTDLDNQVIHEACKRMIRGVPGGGDFNMSLDGAGGFTLHRDINMYVLNDQEWNKPSRR